MTEHTKLQRALRWPIRVYRRIETRWICWKLDRWAMQEHRAGLHVRPTICKLCGKEGPQ